jgi:hypothetical protein
MVGRVAPKSAVMVHVLDVEVEVEPPRALLQGQGHEVVTMETGVVVMMTMMVVVINDHQGDDDEEHHTHNGDIEIDGDSDHDILRKHASIVTTDPTSPPPPPL